MRKEKHTTRNDQGHSSEMKVVSIGSDRSQLEKEIDRHVRHIQSLIRKLRPTERQRYYDGLLSHILVEQVDLTSQSVVQRQQKERDYSSLSNRELELIRELSSKIEELYRTIE